MAADHDDLVLEIGIGAGDLGDGVEAVLVVTGDFAFDIHLERDGHVCLEQPIDAAVVFDGGDDDRNLDCLLGFIRLRAERGAIYGITASATFLGNSLGPLTGGAVAAAFGLRWVFLVTAAVLFVNLLWVYYKVDDKGVLT